MTGWDPLRDDWSSEWLSRGEIGLRQGLVVDEYRVTGRGDRLARETDDPLYEGTHRRAPEGAGRGIEDHDVSSVQDRKPGDDTDPIAGVKGRFHGGRHLDKETDVSGGSSADGRSYVRPRRAVAVEGATSEDSHDHECSSRNDGGEEPPATAPTPTCLGEEGFSLDASEGGTCRRNRSGSELEKRC